MGKGASYKQSRLGEGVGSGFSNIRRLESTNRGISAGQLSWEGLKALTKREGSKSGRWSPTSAPSTGNLLSHKEMRISGRKGGGDHPTKERGLRDLKKRRQRRNLRHRRLNRNEKVSQNRGAQRKVVSTAITTFTYARNPQRLSESDRR